MSIPANFAPIQAVAQQMQVISAQWKPEDSALTDCIFVMCSACGFPMSAYAHTKVYEDIYQRSMTPGRHLYTGNPLPGAPALDWNQLPLLSQR